MKAWSRAPKSDRERSRRETGTSRRTLVRTFRTSAAATVATYGINLALQPFVLHRLGAGLVGTWATVASILAIGGLADAGLRTEIARRVASAKGADDDAGLVDAVHQGVTLLVFMASAVLVVGCLAAPLIRAFAFPDGVAGYNHGQLDLLVRATFVVLAAAFVSDGYFGVLRGIQRGDVETTARVVSVVIGAVVTAAAIASGWGLWALFAGSATQLLCRSAWQWTGLRMLLPELRLRFVRVDRAVARGFLALSSLALLGQVSDIVDAQWDKLVLSHFTGPRSVAAFEYGTSLVIQAKVLALLPIAPLFVAVAELRKKDTEAMERLYRLSSTAALAFCAVILSGVFVFAPSFFQLWLGTELRDAGDAARLFVLAATLNLLSAPLAFRVFGEGRHRLAAAGSLANIVVNAAASFLLTMAIGFNGALYGSIAGNAAGTLVLFALVRRSGTWRWPAWRALTIGAGAAALLVGVGLDEVSSWVTLLAAAGAYTLVVGAACTAAERLPVRSLLRGTTP